MNDHNEQATSANEGRLIGNAEREEGAARWRIQINVKEWEEGINFDLWRWIRRARPTSLNEGEMMELRSDRGGDGDGVQSVEEFGG